MSIKQQPIEFTVKLFQSGPYFIVSIDPHELSADRLHCSKSYVEACNFFNALLNRYSPHYFVLTDKQYNMGGAIIATLTSQGYFKEVP